MMMKPLGNNFYPYPVLPETRFDPLSYNTDLKYCRHASPEFNSRLDRAMDRISEDVREAADDNLIALILGGSYGRGEGGVARIDGQERPCNNFDLTLVVDHKAVDQDQICAAGSDAKESRRLGIRIRAISPRVEEIQLKLPPSPSEFQN